MGGGLEWGGDWGDEMRSRQEAVWRGTCAVSRRWKLLSIGMEDPFMPTWIRGKLDANMENMVPADQGGPRVQ